MASVLQMLAFFRIDSVDTSAPKKFGAQKLSIFDDFAIKLQMLLF